MVTPMPESLARGLESDPLSKVELGGMGLGRLSVILLTITMSIVLHGLSSVPMANYYKRFSPG